MALRVAVGIATAGRPAILAQAVKELAKQTRIPDTILVCAASSDDLQKIGSSDPRVHCLIGPRGSSTQRNEILNRACATDVDIVVFFDDDFVPSRRYIETIEATFVEHMDVVMTTGRVIVDGIRGAGLSWEAGRALLSRLESGYRPQRLRDVYSAYGCNMAVRVAPLFDHRIAFDECLPLYAWLEDVDFSRRLAKFGRIVQVRTAYGVHLGAKLGRESGVRLGYSQIANPIYLVCKGTYSPFQALHLMLRNIAMNLGRSLWPEPYVDRVGRARGNGLAALDLLKGRLTPTRILSL